MKEIWGFPGILTIISGIFLMLMSIFAQVTWDGSMEPTLTSRLSSFIAGGCVFACGIKVTFFLDK